MADGRLEAIFRKWNVWNEDQPALVRERAGCRAWTSRGAPAASTGSDDSRFDATLRYLPALLRAAGITLALSCLAMALAVARGMAIAVGRVYGEPV